MTAGLVSSNDLRTYQLQVGGHGQGPTQGKCMKVMGEEGKCVLKPYLHDGRGEKEAQFYKNVFDTTVVNKVIIALRAILPQYLGLQADDEGNQYLALANKANGFKKPCILDLKIGQTITSPLASPEKQERARNKYKLQATIGFRFVGMKVYEPAKDTYRSYEREYGYSRQEEDIPKAFDDWLDNGSITRNDVVTPAVEAVQEILTWFESNNMFRFYGSSILFVYEGDTSTPDYKGKLAMAFIDFAHVFPIENLSERDEGTIFGLRRLLAFLKSKL